MIVVAEIIFAIIVERKAWHVVWILDKNKSLREPSGWISKVGP